MPGPSPLQPTTGQTRSSPRISDSSPLLTTLFALLLAGIGWLLMVDRPGLRIEYFPLDPSWQGAPAFSGTGAPRVATADELQALFSKQIFSVRWRGWIVTEAAAFDLLLDTDEAGFVRLDGIEYSKGRHPVVVEAGVHSLEVGLAQTGGKIRLQVLWGAPGSEAKPLPVERLHARRPVLLTHLLRQGVRWLSPTYRSLAGALLLLTALLLVQFSWRPGSALHRLTDRLARSSQRRATQIALLGVLFVACWVWTSRFTTPLMGGDDVLYLHNALFPEKGQWFYNRYVHIYLLKAFVWLADGDPFLGARTYWSFIFSVTVAALAVAVKSLGPKLQLRTLAVTLFLLVSQTSLMGRAGGAFADYTNMMFITLAVAVYLHGLSTERQEDRSFGWHELWIGALTLAALKSKETGIILIWLPMLFLWTRGRPDLKRFAVRLGCWTMGFAAAWLLLMTLDGWMLGDFWYSAKPDLAAMKQIHVNQPVEFQRSVVKWLKVIASPDDPVVRHALRYLWLMALATPIIAVLRRRRIELVLLWTMPLAYLAMLIAVHTRAPHIFSTRYFFPIVPVCCLIAAAGLGELGLESGTLRQLLRPRILVPFCVATAAVWLVIVPAFVGSLDPGASAAATPPWPVWLMMAAMVLLLMTRKARPALIVIVLFVLLGPSFGRVQQILDARLLAQRGETILYPWSVFEFPIAEAAPRTIVVAPELWRSYQMVGQNKTRERIAQIFFRDRDLAMWQSRELDHDADIAIAGTPSYRSWRRRLQGLASTAVRDPSGLLILTRPGQVE